MAQLLAFDRDPKTATLRRAVFQARDRAKTTRTHLEAYTLPVFLEYGFVHQRTGEPLSHWSQLYLCDQDPTGFYAHCDRLNRENGYTVPEGHSPALIAEREVILTENALLQHADSHFHLGVSAPYALALREKALKLFLGADPKEGQ